MLPQIMNFIKIKTYIYTADNQVKASNFSFSPRNPPPPSPNILSFNMQRLECRTLLSDLNESESKSEGESEEGRELQRLILAGLFFSSFSWCGNEMG